ncbi:MAG: hypothetical protein JJU37_13330 [Balneolaceae bacterium]|nr:hypothetical protein [Balneolaceae bacterium]
MKKSQTILLIFIASTFMLSCSDNSVGTSNDELDECFGTSIPFPATATITACIGRQAGSELIRGAVFEPGISWSETLKFFSDNYSSGGWNLVKEDIPTRTAGERTAEWDIIGPDFDVLISVTAFGDDGVGTYMVGVIGMYDSGVVN